jgi:hypothetical protein
VADPIVFTNGYLAFTTSTAAAGTYTAPVGLKSVTIPVSRAELEDAAMGDDISATFPGIQSAPISARFRQNYAAGGIDALAFTRWNSKTLFRAKVRPVNGAVSTTNPTLLWTRVYIASITPISGAHGEILYNDLELRPATGCTFSRSTST